ncbi:hypothetical protein ACWDFL_13975 [Streptomyces bungoensis]
MGSLRLTLCTGMLAVMALAPPAYAADGGQAVSVTPASPAPGADVSLRVRGCTGAQGTAASPAFVSDARLTGGQGTLTGDTRVRTSLQPGAYPVRITCSGSVIDQRIVVGWGSASGGPVEAGPGAGSASPFAPVQAGGGGTAHFATVATSGSGPDTAQGVTGLALAGVAAAAVGLLKGRRSRGGN